MGTGSGGRQARDVAGGVVAALAHYVERALGPDALRSVLLAAGRTDDDGTLAAMLSPDGWFSEDEVLALADAAAEMTGDDGIGRRAGEELMRSSEASGVGHFIRAAGDPATALAEVVAYGSKMARGRCLEATAVDECTVEVEARFDGMRPHRFFCDFGPGYWAQVPSLFGAVGTVSETACQRRGAAACRYTIRWSKAEERSPETLAADALSAEALIVAYERLQATATDLAAATTLDDVLDRVVRAADRAVVAPRFVAVLRTADGTVHAAGHGLGSDTDACAAALLVDATSSSYGLPVVAALGGPPDTVGLLAALLPPGSAIGDVDRRLLGAYAGHASAAVAAVMARSSANQSDAINRSLLDLAQRLAAVATPKEVCSRIVDAVPAMIDCRLSSFWRWDEHRRVFALVAHAGPTLQFDQLTEEEVHGIGGLDRARESVLLDVDEVVADKLRIDMVSAGVRRAAVTPVTARGQLLGVVTTGFADHRRMDEGLCQRLLGIADLTATALDNALLVERMRHQSLHDSLTGLPNRPLLQDRVGQAVRSASRSGQQFSLLFIDLDRFKNVNDTLGHSVGDELICRVAERLNASVRSQDTLARMGGDEFVLLLADADGAAGSRVAEKLVASLQEPFDIDGRALYISTSIGIAVFPQHGNDYEQLLLNADAAMYEAKARGRSTWSLHAEVTTRRRELLELEHRLHTAIADDELVVYYQPQVDLATRRLVGVEALVRWEHPELGRLSPDRFLDLAEESGVIVEIDAFVRSRAFAQAQHWQDAGVPLRMSVNLSTADLRRAALVDDLRAEIRSAGLDPSLVEIEITDRVALGEDDLRPTLASISSLGVRLAVDDFGVGSSVLGRLQHGPFDTLKVDRSLVTRIDVESRQAAILHALVTMAHECNLEVVAEGVSTPAQAKVLQSFGCELAQGYLFSEPVPAAAIDHWLAILRSGSVIA